MRQFVILFCKDPTDKQTMQKSNFSARLAPVREDGANTFLRAKDVVRMMGLNATSLYLESEQISMCR